MKTSMNRRDLLRYAGAGIAGATNLFGQAPAFLKHWERDATAYPLMLQIGDITDGRATIWARSDRPSRMIVTWNTVDGSVLANRIIGPHCLESTDFTGRVELRGLPNGQQIQFNVQFEDLSQKSRLSEPLNGKFRTAPIGRNDIRFLWSGDTAGQGWGINPEWGGMRIYETMRRREPHFFIHCGDTVYADGPISERVTLPDGSTWRNVVTEEVSKVAETSDEFRGRYKYNLLDENVRRFAAEVPQIWQWDDHEVTNNWSGSKDLSGDTRYKEKNVPLLVARAAKAFLDYAPMRFSADETERVYRKMSFGPMLDVFVIDQRSYRTNNTHNTQEREDIDTQYLGAEQRAWLKAGLKASTATWKVIASDMPIGLNVGDGRDAQGRARWEAIANADNGPARGREMEFADLFGYIKQNNIRNIVWLTADTHYTAAHYYDPTKAKFTDFLPFWEFMSGPLNAGSFGPNTTDGTFGIQVMYQKHPPAGQVNLPPSAGLQFFGEVNIAGGTEVMTVVLRDLTGAALYTKELVPERNS
jgi:alkaline phosphatase D